MNRSVAVLQVLMLGGALSFAASGCQTEASCFGDCSDGVGGGGGALPVTTIGSGGDIGFTTGTGGEDCVVSNNAIEICDGIDNDCDEQIDEETDFAHITTCGTCENNCYTGLLNVDASTIKCDWGGQPGEAGKCSFDACAPDYFDLDGDEIDCEYYCVKSADDDTVCNNRDDDCDGFTDEDINFCDEVDNCGVCGRSCTVVHGEGECVDESKFPCTAANTSCAIAKCDDEDSDGWPDWWDLDNDYTTGCEYSCTLTQGGIEVCGDGIDNDCDGMIDGADSDLSGDPQIGLICFGDPDGLCATAAHSGLTECQGQKVVCVGANVIKENDVAETCNSVDDDCDGTVDDSAIDAGGNCGISNVFPCKLGTQTCVGGMLTCLGAVDPQVETCNGIDDDCDSMVDLTNGNPPVDSVGDCNVPTAPPMGATSPCKKGTKACVGAVVTCQGSAGPSGPTDSCGDDSNCDGKLTNQPDTQTNVSHCGMCGKDCIGNTEHAQWSCVAGACQFDGCEPNYYDLDNDKSCEYACISTGAEVCDGLDNDCNGKIDDGITAPSPVEVCGVSVAASTAECTNNVAVACKNGSWDCTFPAGVCSPNCATATEICDALDNDCDGGVNENVSGYGLACASDDGIPPPGHGACRKTGTFVCDGANAVKCSAVKEKCANLAAGCTEKCDGVDNDCDGLVDESFVDKGNDPKYFVKPVTVQIANDRWMFAYEASRPDSSVNSPGTGNGYHCTGMGCANGIPPAPGGTILDETPACSEVKRQPWFNVTPIEAEQTCDEMGGFVCSFSDWQSACGAGNNCDWGYEPSGNACLSGYDNNKFCNLGYYDFDANTMGDQDGLLPTGSPKLAKCAADWGAAGKVFDITGNLREIVKSGSNIYPLMGGAFNSLESSATCGFDFYVVSETFQLLDTGFRCCFDMDPTK